MADLVKAAQAVLDRWDSPQWEWATHGPTADLMAELRSALAQAEPVAWRVRRRSEKFWAVCSYKPLDALQDLRFEVEPLYTAPPPPQQVEPVQQRNENLAQRLRAKGYEAEVAGSAVENIKESGNG